MKFATADNPVWGEVAGKFSRGEFRQPDKIAADSLRRLLRLRDQAGVPLVIRSDARDGTAGVSLRGGISAHDERPSTAFDIQLQSARVRYQVALAAFAGDALAALDEIASGRASGERARDLARRALHRPGYLRIGIYPPTDMQRQAFGKNGGSIHVDESERLPQRVCWVSV